MAAYILPSFPVRSVRSVACCAVCYLLLGRHKSEQAMEGQPAGCVCAPLDCASRVGLPPNSPQTCRADTYMRIWHFIAACRARAQGDVAAEAAAAATG